MVSIIGLDSEKVQLLCDAANEEVDEKNKVQIANFLCPVRSFCIPFSFSFFFLTFQFLQRSLVSRLMQDLFCDIRVTMQFQEV